MLVSPKNSHVEILTASVMAFGGGAFGWWVGHESAALMNRISALVKETQYSFLGNPMDRGAWRATVHGATKSQTWLLATKQRKRPQRAPSSLLPCEDRGTVAIYVPGSEPSPDTGSAGAVILDFSPKTVRSKCLLFTTHPVSGRLLQQTEQLRQFTSIMNSIIQY